MQIERLVSYIDDSTRAARWLEGLGLENIPRAHENLVALSRHGIPIELLAVVFRQLEQSLVRQSDPDMALNNFDRFVAAVRSPLALASLFERDPEGLPTLLQILSTSQYLSDLIIRDPDGFDLLRLTDGQPVAREALVAEICSEAANLPDERAVAAALRRYKQRETLRIAYGDIIRKQRVETVTRQVSYLADAICEAALRTARADLERRRGVPRTPQGDRARCVVLALGKLGGTELNYSSDIDLVILADVDGRTDAAQAIGNQEFFERLVRSFVKLLGEQTELGAAYRVDLRLRPEGDQGQPVISLDSALRYYDVKGRTWERQAFVKARAIAGDLELGNEFLQQLQPWIYRRYLSRADISGIKALKRRIEQRARREGADETNVKTGHGGLRDIEFVIQFLQLLNGGDLHQLRTGNTLEAIEALEQVGCLTHQERTLLAENYAFLRKVEHRLQIMFDLQTHTLPESDEELRRVAIRMGFEDGNEQTALTGFKEELRTKTELNHKILSHLLYDAFGDDTESSPETDLVLDPDPEDSAVAEILGRYNFCDVADAYRNLMSLANERISFLSTRRCRHFLASIAPRLLAAIATTPDPDATLVSLSKISDSLGGKGMLWELFSSHPPSLQLYVQLCASSPYLAGILTSNPGMVDELMDCLLLDKLPSHESLAATLAELCRGAEDVEAILHSFKHAQHLRVGARDILGKDDIRSKHRTLSDVAEVCLAEIIKREYSRLVDRFGEPSTTTEDERSPCSLVVLALGKLGGKEPNYHSDLDVVFLYETEGMTWHTQPGRREETTTNQHFFSQLGQRIIKAVTQLGPFGRLYDLDPRLRPTGKSGALATSLEELRRYFTSGQGQLWERQALCKARPIFGTEQARHKAMQVVADCVVDGGWQPGDAERIRTMRLRLEETASKRNLKRGPGGTMDIEFGVQMLQLRHAAETPEVLESGTLDAIAALQDAGYLSRQDATFLSGSYRLLRSVESGLRLMNTTARHDLPTDPSELEKLAYLLGFSDGGQLALLCIEQMAENRRGFERIFADPAVASS